MESQKKRLAPTDNLATRYDTGRNIETMIPIIIKKHEIDVHIFGRCTEIAHGTYTGLYRISPPTDSHQRIDISPNIVWAELYLLLPYSRLSNIISTPTLHKNSCADNDTEM